eukprot:1147736-Pelagomonas_calceolata.AAC.1
MFSKRSHSCSITGININCPTNSTNLQHTLVAADSLHDKATQFWECKISELSYGLFGDTNPEERSEIGQFSAFWGKYGMIGIIRRRLFLGLCPRGGVNIAHFLKILLKLFTACAAFPIPFLTERDAERKLR